MFYMIFKFFYVFFIVLWQNIVSNCLSWQFFHDLLRWLYNLRLSSLVFPSSVSNEAHSSDHRPPLSSGLLHLQAPTGQSKSEWHAFPWKPQEHLPLMITEGKKHMAQVWWSDIKFQISCGCFPKAYIVPTNQVNRVMSYS